MIGARQGAMTALQRLVAGAMARDVHGFVVPGPDVARAAGLDLDGAGIHPAATPRHASVLVVIGPLSGSLSDAASVAYAQMPRPRAILALGAGDLAPLPDADATGPLTQTGLVAAMAELRRVIATGAFRPDVHDFEARALQVRTEYTCPMHPEVVMDEPGDCPKCGMTLVPRETSGSPHAGHAMPEKEHGTPDTPGHALAEGHDHAAETAAQYTCPMHPEVVMDEPGSCPKCGMTLVPVEASGSPHAGHAMPEKEHGTPDSPGHALVEDHDHAAETAAQYTCPMHPEVVMDEPGDCPKCGMTLVPRASEDQHVEHDKRKGGENAGHAGHDAQDGGATIDGIEAHFMSMADMTETMPSSPDGLKMEWIDVPFGPFFPGLPGGLHLNLTLDGDAVADEQTEGEGGHGNLLRGAAMSPTAFADHLAALSPLSPVAYRLLACLALEQAAGSGVPSEIARARAAAAERERISSHLGWLAGFGAQSGFGWLKTRAATLQLKIRDASVGEIAALAPAITALHERVRRTPLLNGRLGGIGRLEDDATLPGPTARAAGIVRDARSDDPAYAALGFAVQTGTGGDAMARLTQRCNEIAQSLDLIARADDLALPVPGDIGTASGNGDAVVETPRGAARLSLTLTDGKVTSAEIATPTAAHVASIEAVAKGQELGDALTAIGSLDISPWEIAT